MTRLPGYQVYVNGMPKTPAEINFHDRFTAHVIKYRHIANAFCFVIGPTTCAELLAAHPRDFLYAADLCDRLFDGSPEKEYERWYARLATCSRRGYCDAFYVLGQRRTRYYYVQDWHRLGAAIATINLGVRLREGLWKS